MLSVAEAMAAILSEAQPLEPVTVALAEALGLVLAEDVCADLDSPPFDKALMDGYAVVAADLPEGRGRLQVVEEILAGKVPGHSVGPGKAARIMTGAPLPPGADAVVPVELTRLLEVENVAIEANSIAPGQNVLNRGASVKMGERVLAAGSLLRPQELGCLAEMGRARCVVRRRPRVAVLATGDELVPVAEVPRPGQIRNSNETMLSAQLRRLGAEVTSLGIARDDANELRERIAAGLRYDMLLLSGGVSAGKLDLVPSVLADLRVRQVFHKVRIKPGQPLWFGVHDDARCLVFGLPGNPVSSMVCCELFARTAVRKMAGMEPAQPPAVPARLTCEHESRGSRPVYHPAKLEWTDEGAQVTPVAWIGSADLCATVAANAMVLFPVGDRTYALGSRLEAYPW
ncbi:MAG: molybdopterin molybdotransferase MoeA [Planctomycetaceae bacterium]